MKVSVELNVSDKEFYDVMMKSLQEELNHVSKKKLELEIHNFTGVYRTS